LTVMISAALFLLRSPCSAAGQAESKHTEQATVTETVHDKGVTKLKKANTWLYVRTSPRGAEVSVDGKPLGKSNDLFVVEPGVRRIIVELDGHGTEGREIVIKAGEIRRVELDLKRRAETVTESSRKPSAARSEQPAGVSRKVSSPVAFGPVIERVVNDDDPSLGNFLIDLDTGKLISPPLKGMQKAGMGLVEWAAENGIDAVGETKSSVRGLMGIDMIAVPIPSGRWQDLSPQDVAEAVALGKPGRPIPISGKGDLPATYIFSTREGGMGSLQIVGFASEPRGVKIRYKMVQSVQHEEPQPETTSSSSKLDFRVAAAKKDFDVERDIPDFHLPPDDAADSPPDSEYVWCKIKGKPPEDLVTVIRVGTTYALTYVLLSSKPHEVMLAGDLGDRSWGLTQAAVTTTADGRWSVAVRFDEEGGRRFADLTKANLKRKLAVLVDDEVWMCPVIQSTIHSKVEITGDFDQQEAEQLAAALRRGMVRSGSRGKRGASSKDVQTRR
jgi:SecD-like export protein/PEGA domain-containing protein